MKVSGKAEVGKPAIQVCVVGGGWYGCHIALELAKKGYKVTLKESNTSLFSQISGQFGIRLHTGQHYPRSDVTRESCRKGNMAFTATYPDLIVSHEYSHYALGVSDADGKPPKVSEETFKKVCHEGVHCNSYYADDKLDREQYPNIQALADIPEPSIKVGRGLAGYFEKKLKSADVKIEYGHKVKSVERAELNDHSIKSRATIEAKVTGTSPSKSEILNEDYDYVINATNYQSIKPNKNADTALPFAVVYQVCLAIVVEDTKPTSEKPFSKIIMDGFNPCLMPIVEYDNEKDQQAAKKPQQYILTHGKYTIGGSHPTPEAAQQQLEMFTDQYMKKHVLPLCMEEMERYMPGFQGRFKVKGFRKAVLTKPVANTEYRGALIFRNYATGLIEVIAGKVSNIFDAAREVLALISANQNNDQKMIKSDQAKNYSYLVGGTFDSAQGEFSQNIADPTQNTCMLQTYDVNGLVKKPESKTEKKDGATATVLIEKDESVLLGSAKKQKNYITPTLMLSTNGNKVACLLFFSALASYVFTTLNATTDTEHSYVENCSLLLMFFAGIIFSASRLNGATTISEVCSFWRKPPSVDCTEVRDSSNATPDFEKQSPGPSR